MSTDLLAGAAADLDALSHAARDGALDAAAAVSALGAVRRLAADLEQAELALRASLPNCRSARHIAP